jgi:hypothetical protein
LECDDLTPLFSETVRFLNTLKVSTFLCDPDKIGAPNPSSRERKKSISPHDKSLITHGYNISSDDGGGFLNGPGDQINTDPLLGPLQDNGGPTFTHELLKGSPAIDAGDPNFTPPPLL